MTENPPYTITSHIFALAERIGEAIGRAVEAAASTDLRLRRINHIRTIHGSLAIEGNTLSEEQVSTILDGKPVVAPLREIQEARNAIKAYEQYPQWEPAGETDLLSAHEVLMTALVDAPGHYRRGGVAVTGAGEVHHIGPPADRVPRLMSELLAWLGSTSEHPLIASSVFHYEFANAGGGTILIGVSDTGEIVGVADHNRLKSRVQSTRARRNHLSSWKSRARAESCA